MELEDTFSLLQINVKSINLFLYVIHISMDFLEIHYIKDSRKLKNLLVLMSDMVLKSIWVTMYLWNCKQEFSFLRDVRLNCGGKKNRSLFLPALLQCQRERQDVEASIPLYILLYNNLSALERQVMRKTPFLISLNLYLCKFLDVQVCALFLGALCQQRYIKTLKIGKPLW